MYFLPALAPDALPLSTPWQVYEGGEWAEPGDYPVPMINVVEAEADANAPEGHLDANAA